MVVSDNRISSASIRCDRTVLEPQQVATCTGTTTLAGLENGGLQRCADEVRRRGLPTGTVSAPPVSAPTPPR